MLFARLPLESHVGLDHKGNLSIAQSARKDSPAFYGENHAEVGHRHRVAVDGIPAGDRAAALHFMQHELVPVHIEVDPRAIASPLWKAENISVERSTRGEVRNRDGQVKPRMTHGRTPINSTPAGRATPRKTDRRPRHHGGCVTAPRPSVAQIGWTTCRPCKPTTHFHRGAARRALWDLGCTQSAAAPALGTMLAQVAMVTISRKRIESDFSRGIDIRRISDRDMARLDKTLGITSKALEAAAQTNIRDTDGVTKLDGLEIGRMILGDNGRTSIDDLTPKERKWALKILEFFDEQAKLQRANPRPDAEPIDFGERQAPTVGVRGTEQGQDSRVPREQVEDLVRKLEDLANRQAGLPEMKTASLPIVTTSPDGSGEYPVQPGDTLWSIAERHLGDPRRWREIHQYADNADKIADPNKIYPNQVIKLPPNQSDPSHYPTSEIRSPSNNPSDYIPFENGLDPRIGEGTGGPLHNHGRKLSSEEKLALYEIFGSSLNTDRLKLQVVQDPEIKTLLDLTKTPAITLFDTIFINPSYLSRYGRRPEHAQLERTGHGPSGP